MLVRPRNGSGRGYMIASPGSMIAVAVAALTVNRATLGNGPFDLPVRAHNILGRLDDLRGSIVPYHRLPLHAGAAICGCLGQILQRLLKIFSLH
jgi:hypothetical protein